MSRNTAVIIGAGIAGPALGIALQRAGFEPVVCEASDRHVTTSAHSSIRHRMASTFYGHSDWSTSSTDLAFRTTDSCFTTKPGGCLRMRQSAA